MLWLWTQWHLFQYHLVYVCAVHVQSRIGCSPKNSNDMCIREVFKWQYITMSSFKCIVLLTVILRCYCPVYMSRVLTLWIKSQLIVFSYTYCSYTWTLTSWNPLGHSRPVVGLLYILPLRLLYMLYFNPRDCSQFNIVHALHIYTQVDTEADVIASTYPHASVFQHQ
jgi:hypothetical protein